jgi:hypothetical protein
MKITILPLLLLCLFFSSRTFAQNPYSVKGAVIDSSSNLRLVNTTICVLNAKDSTLRQFVRAGVNGTFTLNKLTKGNFILLVSYPDYADYVEHFSLNEAKPQHDFGKLNLRLKSKILQEVLIKGTVAAMKIKGDTTEFNAKAYTIQPNSKVEDLLKQLPGIQVDKDGKITAQGQEVKKVLVDGEEFFGDDPTLVTKNIRGDMVDKVQLYDKKSDQATFTGVDDGEKTKTINIKLKEDKKNGYFGKVDAGVGTDGYYSAQAMYNRFKGKKKFSAYGIASNTGKTGLGWEDSDKYGASNTTVGDDGSIFISGGGGDLDSFDGRYNGQGIPIAQTGGIHFDNKWDNDKKTANANYKAGYLEVDGNTNIISQRTLPGSSINNNSNQDFKNSVFRQKLDYAYTTKLDTTSTLKLTIDGTQKTTKNSSNNISTSISPSNNAGIADTLLNTNQRTLTNNVDNQIFNASAFYTKKFKKTGRTVSVNLAGNFNNSNARGFLKSEIDFYNRTTALLDSTQNIDQYKTTVTKSHNFNGNATYTEPLNKKASMVFNYGLGDINNNSDRKSFNNNGGAYNQLDTKYSNDYTVNQLSNNFGATLNYRATKSTLNISARAAAVNFKQTDEIAHQEFSRNFLNWNPSASYQYRFTQQKSFRISYYGYTNQPSIDQIQPILVNNDPLNQQLGNPLLKPSFNNSFSMNYNSYKILSDESIWLSGSYSFTDNAIVSNNINKTTGVSSYQSVNLTDHQPYNFYFNGSYGQKIPGLNLNVSLYATANGNKSYNFSNSVLNTTTSSNYSGQLGIYKSKQKKYDIRIGAGPGYSFGKTSLDANTNNNGYTFNGYGYFNVYLPGKIQISSDGTYQYKGKTQTFNETFSQLILNASINKTFLKQDNLKLSLSGNDLLDQNRGFNRNSFGGSITQTSYTTIRRYFLFSITWDFNKMGGAPQPNSK